MGRLMSAPFVITEFRNSQQVEAKVAIENNYYI